MKIFSLLFTALISLGAMANIRVGRTGGGLAEMKAYSVLQQIPTIVKLCASEAINCGLTPQQKGDLVQLNRKIPLEQIKLTTPWPGKTYYAASELKINSQDLYVAEIPKKFGEILGLSLSILLRDGLQIPNAQWPLTVFTGYRERQSTLELRNLNLKLHSLSLSSSEMKIIQALALEKEKVTIDLSPAMVSAMACAAPAWQIERWSYDETQSWVRAQMRWVCGQNEFSGELQILLNAEGVSRMGIVRKLRIR